jgi:hypothetical protein
VHAAELCTYARTGPNFADQTAARTLKVGTWARSTSKHLSSAQRIWYRADEVREPLLPQDTLPVPVLDMTHHHSVYVGVQESE